MPRKFNKKYEIYSLGRFKPMSVELDRAGLGKYRDLANNPIYWNGAIQYTGGQFYRAVLGYETLWDRKVEANLMLCLDYLISDYRDRKQYYFENLLVHHDFKLHGLAWPRGIAPKTFRFDLQWPYEMKAGENLLARVNLLDKPNHVDIERETGEVFTIPFLRYQNYIAKGGFRRKGNSYGKEPNAAKGIPTTKGESAKVVRLYGRKELIRSHFKKLSNLR